MDIIFLGTNGWYDSPTGSTICTLINSKHYHILLDAGNGIHKADRYIKDDLPVFLFLSHFHLDHIVGLHVMNKFSFPRLTILGQKGTAQVLNTIVNEPFTVPLDRQPYAVEIRELLPGPYKMPFPLDCRFLRHASPCLGCRLDLDGKTIAYIPETGPCENAVLLAQDADLVIAECAFHPGEESQVWPHLTPQDAADIARQARAKKLALTHFDAGKTIIALHGFGCVGKTALSLIETAALNHIASSLKWYMWVIIASILFAYARKLIIKEEYKDCPYTNIGLSATKPSPDLQNTFTPHG